MLNKSEMVCAAWSKDNGRRKWEVLLELPHLGVVTIAVQGAVPLFTLQDAIVGRRGAAQARIYTRQREHLKTASDKFAVITTVMHIHSG
jgi:hypothetical protein